MPTCPLPGQGGGAERASLEGGARSPPTRYSPTMSQPRATAGRAAERVLDAARGLRMIGTMEDVPALLVMLLALAGSVGLVLCGAWTVPRVR